MTPITCHDVEEQDLEARYLAGTLSEAEAEAFEAHYFGCDRCWQAVQQGLEVRAAALPPRLRRRAPWRTWWPLAAAAALAVLLLAPWLFSGGDERLDTAPGETVRGTPPALVLVSSVRGGQLVAAWPRLPDAEVYQVRLYTADGTLLLGRETGDTTVAVTATALPLPQGTRTVFWQVQALNQLRRPVARSELTAVQLRTNGL